MEYYQNQNAGSPSNMMPVEDHKALAIVALVLSILCCNIISLISIIFAIIGLVKSNDVRKYMMMGQQEMADLSSRRAWLFSWIAIGIQIVTFIGLTIAFFAVGGLEGYKEILEGMMQK